MSNIRINSKITADLANFIKDQYDVNVTSEEVQQYPEVLANLTRLQYWIDEVLLARYFRASENPEEEGIYWTQQLDYDTRMTGERLKNILKDMGDVSILDVGCGDNDWKREVGDNVYGIDPYNSNADEMVGVMEFKTDKKYDVVLCLGSLNFGSEDTIKNQVIKVCSLVKPGGKIYWRCNPGITHDNEHAKWIDFFPWTQEKMAEWAELLGFNVDVMDWDHQGEETIRWGNRIYSEWSKLPYRGFKQ